MNFFQIERYLHFPVIYVELQVLDKSSDLLLLREMVIDKS